MNEQLSMTPDEALQTVIAEAHGRAFLGRLAELGHVPQNEKEAQALVDLGFKLAAIAADPRVKAAAETQASAGPYETAMRLLDQYVDGQTKQAATPETLDDTCWAIANELAQDPRVFTAATLVKAAQAGLLQG